MREEAIQAYAYTARKKKRRNKRKPDGSNICVHKEVRAERMSASRARADVKCAHIKRGRKRDDAADGVQAITMMRTSISRSRVYGVCVQNDGSGLGVRSSVKLLAFPTERRTEMAGLLYSYIAGNPRNKCVKDI